jgi:hypothetical protein
METVWQMQSAAMRMHYMIGCGVFHRSGAKYYKTPNNYTHHASHHAYRHAPQPHPQPHTVTPLDNRKGTK